MHKLVTSRHVDHPPCILAGPARYVGEGCGGIDRQQEDLMEQVDSFFFFLSFFFAPRRKSTFSSGSD